MHDEYGRIDPAKAAEPSKPRGSSNAKRPARPSDEGLQMKRPRVDDAQSHSIDAMIDPALFAVDLAQDASNESQQVFESGIFEESPFQSHAPTLPGSDVYPGAVATVPPAIDPALSSATVMPNGVHEANFKTEPDGDVRMTGLELQQHDTAGVPDPNEHAIIDSPEVNTYTNGITPTKSKSGSPSLQRHSSRQPKQVERYMPEENRSPSNAKSLPKPAHRGSSVGSGRPSPASVKSRRSSSNTSGAIHQMNGMLMKREEARPRSMSTASSVLDEDERLARELQAQEHGLRRRASMRQ